MFASASSSTRVLSHRLATLHRCLDRTRCDIQKTGSLASGAVETDAAAATLS